VLLSTIIIEQFPPLIFHQDIQKFAIKILQTHEYIQLFSERRTRKDREFSLEIDWRFSEIIEANVSSLFPRVELFPPSVWKWPAIVLPDHDCGTAFRSKALSLINSAISCIFIHSLVFHFYFSHSARAKKISAFLHVRFMSLLFRPPMSELNPEYPKPADLIQQKRVPAISQLQLPAKSISHVDDG